MPVSVGWPEPSPDIGALQPGAELPDHDVAHRRAGEDSGLAGVDGVEYRFTGLYAQVHLPAQFDDRESTFLPAWYFASSFSAFEFQVHCAMREKKGRHCFSFPVPAIPLGVEVLA